MGTNTFSGGSDAARTLRGLEPGGRRRADQLNGTFEARPTKFEGKTTTGTFTATKSA
jgi:hypothetical protein